LEDIDVDGRTILEWFLEEQGRRCDLDSSGSGKEPVAGSCEYGYKIWVS
jgi:hypothetical protein